MVFHRYVTVQALTAIVLETTPLKAIPGLPGCFKSFFRMDMSLIRHILMVLQLFSLSLIVNNYTVRSYRFVIIIAVQ